MEISVGHTPDADDAFMFYGMFTGKVATHDFTVKLEQLMSNYDDLVIKLKSYPYDFNKMCQEYEDLVHEIMTKREELIAKRRPSFLWRMKTLAGIIPRFVENPGFTEISFMAKMKLEKGKIKDL